MFWRKKEKRSFDFSDVLLDAKNLPKYERPGLDGTFERPLAASAYVIIAIIVLAFVGLYVYKLVQLQVVQGEGLAERARQNMLASEVAFAKRGGLFDRYGEPLAYISQMPDGLGAGMYVSNEDKIKKESKSNNEEDNDKGREILEIEGPKTISRTQEPEIEFPFRRYGRLPAISHLIGYVRPPAKDSKGFYYRDVYEPASGLEKLFNERLSGANGRKIVERDARMDIVSEQTLQAAQNGENITLALDVELSQAYYDALQAGIEEGGYQAGAGAIMDVHTGEIVAWASNPSYDPEILAYGTDDASITEYFNSPEQPLLNRVIQGVYAPGSIVKPFVSLAALHENIISPGTYLYSNGALRLPNRFNPSNPTIFKDNAAHGSIDMRDAIAVSSNVYFYIVGGGFMDQAGLGIARLAKYARIVGFGRTTDSGLDGEKAGNVPDPEWKKETFPDERDWTIGNTYHTSIGQYGYQVTLLQALRAVSAIANDGHLMKPEFELNAGSKKSAEKLPFSKEDLRVVQEGMRQGAIRGSGKGLNIPDFTIATKTGTAEVGRRNEFKNAWVIGYFPYEDPKYAFATVLERGPKSTWVGGVYASRRFLDWVRFNRGVEGDPLAKKPEKQEEVVDESLTLGS